jgi:hypothetical protein
MSATACATDGVAAKAIARPTRRSSGAHRPLYPDPRLSQALVASIYPLELVKAEQWLKRNFSLSGTQLMDAARQQNWDASVEGDGSGAGGPGQADAGYYLDN